MIRAIIVSFFFLAVAVVVAETDLADESFRGGQLYPDSLSSQGVGLYCVHRGQTTATAMMLKKADTNQILAMIPVRSIYSVPKKHKNWLTVKWNPGGTMVAIHDSLDKHSKVLIYRRASDGSFHKVLLPDMLKLEAGGRLGLEVSTIASSGQEPKGWKNENLLMVNYRFETKGGALYRRTLPITIDDSGRYQPQ